VHRVGRTGRAGRKGTAYTLLDPVNEEAYAPVVVKALTQAKQAVPDDLAALAAAFREKAKAGQAKWASSGFVGNRGYKFDDDELTEEQKIAKAEQKQFETENLGLYENDLVFDDDLDDDDDDENAAAASAAAAAKIHAHQPFLSSSGEAAASSSDVATTAVTTAADGTVVKPSASVLASALASQPGKAPLNAAQNAINALNAVGKNMTPLERAKMLAAHFGKAPAEAAPTNTPQARALANARALAASIGNGAVPTLGSGVTPQNIVLTPNSGPVPHPTNPLHFYDELDINDFPPEARVKAVQRDVILRISEDSGAAVIARGTHVAPGKQPAPGEKRLYLAIEASTDMAVRAAKTELLRVLNEQTLAAAAGGSNRFKQAYGKYAFI